MKKEKINLSNVAYIDDDIDWKDLLLNVGLSACPSNAVEEIKSITNIIKLSKSGGNVVVSEFIEYILNYLKK